MLNKKTKSFKRQMHYIAGILLTISMIFSKNMRTAIVLKFVGDWLGKGANLSVRIEAEADVTLLDICV